MCSSYREIYIRHGFSYTTSHVKLPLCSTTFHNQKQLLWCIVTSHMCTCAGCDIEQWNCVVQFSPMECTFCYVWYGLLVMVHIWHSDIMKNESHWKINHSRKDIYSVICAISNIHSCSEKKMHLCMCIVNFINMHSIYMNLLYITICTKHNM